MWLLDLRGRCGRPPSFLRLKVPSRITTTLGSLSRVCSEQHNVKCVWLKHKLHVGVAEDGSVEDDIGVFDLVNEEVESLIANTDGDRDQRQDDRLDDAINPLSTTLTVLLCQLSY